MKSNRKAKETMTSANKKKNRKVNWGILVVPHGEPYKAYSLAMYQLLREWVERWRPDQQIKEDAVALLRKIERGQVS